MISSPGSILMFLLKYPKTVLKMFSDLFQSSHKIVPFYNLKYPLVLLRAIRLLLDRGFVPNEALQLGLLQLDFPKTELCKFTSTRKMVRIQNALNPLTWVSLTTDKSIFAMYCTALGIPIPKLYAIFFRKNAGYSTDGRILSSREHWQEFIYKVLPSEFIIKPAHGAYGTGIICFIRTSEDDFIDAGSGQRYTPEGIYDIMYSYSKDETFVIQERLINHPGLTKLSNTEYLQTVRALTFVGSNGQSQLLHAFLKPIVGQNIIDNHDHGRTGNLLAEINLDTGSLKPAVKLTPNVSGIQTVISHPITGIHFEGYPIPLWDDVCNLAKEASLKFFPLRLIGWDIAITPKGPFILEANFYSDPPSFHKTMDVILSKIYESQ